MAWQIPASYKGVPFFVEGTEDEFSRRGAHHQFPYRNKGVWEDIGGDDTVYNIPAYVTETSPGGYAAARDKLIAACREGGAGNLVHPYYGTVRVQCIAFRVSHDDTENGVARFSFTFIEALDPYLPSEVDDKPAKINDAADAVQLVVVEDFGSSWNLSGVPGFVHDAGLGLVESLEDVLTGFAGPLPGILGDMSKFIDGTARLLGVTSDAFDDPKTFFLRQTRALTGIIGKSLALGRSIAGLTRTLSMLSGSERTAYQTQQRLMTTGRDQPPSPENTPTRQSQAENQKSLQRLVSCTAVIEAARMTPYIDFTSRDEAIRTRDTLMDQLDAITEAAPDDVYRRIESLRAVVVADINRRAPELGRIARYTPKKTEPALVLAYKIYGDASMSDDLVMRNQISHPGFVPGGDSLEVLLDP